MVISNYVPVNTEIQNCAQYSVNMFYSLTTIYTVDTRGAILLLNNSYLYGNGQFLIVPVCISNVPTSSLARLSLLRTFGLTFWTKFRIQNALPWTGQDQAEHRLYLNCSGTLHSKWASVWRYYLLLLTRTALKITVLSQETWITNNSPDHPSLRTCL